MASLQTCTYAFPSGSGSAGQILYFPLYNQVGIIFVDLYDSGNAVQSFGTYQVFNPSSTQPAILGSLNSSIASSKLMVSILWDAFNLANLGFSSSS